MVLSLLIYTFYLFLLIVFLFVLLNGFVYFKNYNTNLSELRTLDLEQELSSLVLQKEENLLKIGELQDKLASILLSSKKKLVLDSILEFFYNNSDFFVGISIFLIVLTIVNLFGQPDIADVTSGILKNNGLGLAEYMLRTKYFSKELNEKLFTKLTDLEKINVELILQQLSELSSKIQTIDTQILQILDLLSK